jgi:iron(III) transport system permease protein
VNLSAFPGLRRKTSTPGSASNRRAAMATISYSGSRLNALALARSGHAKHRTPGGLIITLAIAAVTLAPVLYVFAASFDASGIGEPYRFGLSGWEEMFSNAKTANAIAYSFILSARVPIAICFAIVIAWLLIRVDIPGGKFIEFALWFGFFLPTVPMVMGWTLLLDRNYGLINLALAKLPFVHGPVFAVDSVPGIMWLHLAMTTIPLMVILLTPAFRQLDAAYEEAADMAGASTWMTLRRITLPLLAPAIITAFLAALIRSLETFEVEQIVGTPVGIYVYATRIYDLISWEPPLLTQAMALAALFLLLLLILAVPYQMFLVKSKRSATLSGRGVLLKARMQPWWAWPASIGVMLYVAFSIVLPFATLIVGSFAKLFGFFFIDDAWTISHWLAVLLDATFLRSAVNSIVLGIAVGTLGLIVYSLIAWMLERGNLPGGSLVGIMVWLPWAIPGLVLGLTLLSLLLKAPLISGLYGTIVPLVIALVVKELPLGVQLLRTSVSQVSAELEEAAEVSGADFPFTFRKVILPLISPMAVSVFILVFAATIRDISTVVLIAAPGVRTLSLLMFDFASSGRLESAAVIGVLIAFLCVGMSFFAYRTGMRMEPDR